MPNARRRSIASCIYETLFDLVGKQKRTAEINTNMAAAGFWDNQEKAQEVVGELRRLTLTLKPLVELCKGADDLGVLIEFAEEEEEPGESTAELVETDARIAEQLEQLELQAMMGAPEDGCNAFVVVQAGEGGTDASDWAEMLLRMYTRWAERRGFKSELLEISPAEEAGIRSATLAIRGDYAYGHLRSEIGNHRLVRISPFDSAGRRQTSFAAVDVVPELEESFEVDIDWGDSKIIREDTMRASGAGGQHVNKTDSAIRLTYLPTGVVTQCQSQRSQHKNRASARKMMTAKLYKLEQDKRDAELAAKRGQKSRVGFGGETIRSYVLHPDQYVKDTRSGHKAGNPSPVLEGDLDPFIEAWLSWSLKN